MRYHGKLNLVSVRKHVGVFSRIADSLAVFCSMSLVVTRVSLFDVRASIFFINVGVKDRRIIIKWLLLFWFEI